MDQQQTQPSGGGVMSMGGEAQAQPSPEQGMQPEEQVGLDDNADDGLPEGEYSADIQKNLEDHLNNLSPEQQQFLATYATTPEVATVIGLINGKEVYDYFAKYVDQNKRIKVETVSSTPPAQPGSAPSAPAPQQPSGGAPMAQGQPSAQPAGPAGGVFQQ